MGYFLKGNIPKCVRILLDMLLRIRNRTIISLSRCETLWTWAVIKADGEVGGF